MSEILKSFGIEGKILIWQAINFGILFAILWKFMYKPIRKVMKEREEKVKESLEKAEKLEATLKPLLEENPGSLKLSGKYIATDEVKIIGNYSLMKSVKSLDLSDNQINDEALQYLFESDILEGLEELYLQINFLTGNGLSELAKSEKVKLKNLKVLVLSDNRLSDSSIAEMMLSSHFQNLESLDVGWNEAGKETAKALGKTITLPKLKKLEMSMILFIIIRIRSL